KKPKQFLNLFGDHTMLQTTVDRIEELIPAERIWVITNDRYVDLVNEQLPDVPTDNIVGEAVAKNTAPCVALAATLIQERDEEATMAVLPADHLIKDTPTFLSILQTAEAKARAGNNLVTIGIQPDRPETGYGYIEFEKDSAGIYDGREVKKVRQFREKPNAGAAQAFLDSGNFLWNSGMFIWSASTILEQFRKYQPEIYEPLEHLLESLTEGVSKEAIDAFYHACPSISIDYSIMDPSQDVFVVSGSFGCNDVGSWKAGYELWPKDEDRNVIQSDTTQLIKSSKNIVHSNSNKMIALIGVDNLAVVETNDAILVCNLDEAQGVKQVVNELRKSEDGDKYL